VFLQKQSTSRASQPHVAARLEFVSATDEHLWSLASRHGIGGRTWLHRHDLIIGVHEGVGVAASEARSGVGAPFLSR
jgi:hypothetical protein